MDPLFLASPRHTFSALISGLFTSKELTWALIYTVGRTFAGLTVASILGIPIGLLIGGVREADRLFGNTIDGLRSMPATALYPAFMLLFGVGELSKIAVPTFVCLWALTIYTSYGVRHSGTTRRFLLRIHRVSRKQFFLDGLFYPALPSILGGMRTAISLALVVTVGVEMLVGTKYGIGQSIYVAQQTYTIPMMYAAIVLLGISGIIINRLFLALTLWWAHWDDAT